MFKNIICKTGNYLHQWNVTSAGICSGSLWISLLWRHNACNGVSDHQSHNYLLNRLFRRRSRKTSKLRVTGLCEGNLPMSGEFPAQRASNAENASIRWRHHAHYLAITSRCSTSPDTGCFGTRGLRFNPIIRTSHRRISLCEIISLAILNHGICSTATTRGRFIFNTVLPV